MYNAKVLADSIPSHTTGIYDDSGTRSIRLITVEVTFPRFILAEVNTHRVFSRNSASSRAIPTERLIRQVRDEPFIPETFNERVKGMGVGEAFKERDQKAARAVWENAAEYAVRYAEQLAGLKVDKSRVNRLLEPFMWHTAIITSTEWENFFALRCPPGNEATTDFPAQLEFQKIALLMREAMRASEPKVLHTGEWHLPLVATEEMPMPSNQTDDQWFKTALVSAGRCARVSFDRQGEYEQPVDSVARAERLRESGHLSPFEHVARPYEVRDAAIGLISNLYGWVQLRKLIPHEENRVGHLEERPSWDAAPTAAV